MIIYSKKTARSSELPNFSYDFLYLENNIGQRDTCQEQYRTNNEGGMGWAFSGSLIFQIESIMRDKKLSEVN